jgi:O-antigen ligase
MSDWQPTDRLVIEPAHPTAGVPAVLAVYFAFFLFCASFSIAASQIILGLGMILFLITLTRHVNRVAIRPLKPFLLMVGIYVLWMFVSALFGESPLKSIWSLKEEWLFLTVLISACLFRDSRYSERLVLALAVGLILVGTYGIVQSIWGVNWFRSSRLGQAGGIYRPSGNFSHPLTYGNFVVTTTLFLLGFTIVRFRRLAGRGRLVLVSASVIGLVITSLLGSRGPMLAAFCGLLVLGLLARKLRYILPALLVAVAAAWFIAPNFVDLMVTKYQRDLSPSNSLGRLYIWNTSLKIFADHPATGIGSANFEEEYRRHLVDHPDAPVQGHAHSDYINVAVLYGIPGLLLYLGVWFVTLKSLWRAYQANPPGSIARALSFGALMASVAFLVSAVTEATFADEEVRQVLMAIWGAGFSALPIGSPWSEP